MDEYALALHSSSVGGGGAQIIPHNASPADGVVAEGYIEPIAEHNFARKKMHSLETDVGSLRKDARQLHETVTQQAADMKIMVSELDLRRAIGLAFQEFELRLEDAFTDSNRRCLAMFSKREEVQDVQVKIEKKVNWNEYNVVMKKLSDLRQYIDTMAESVFIGHRDALNSEFAKKADAHMVEQALKAKADFSQVSDVLARLERLEVLVQHTDTRHSETIEAIRAELTEQSKAEEEKHQASISENKASITALRTEAASLASRLGRTEGQIGGLNDVAKKVMEAVQNTKGEQDKVMSSIDGMLDQLGRLDHAAAQTREDLQTLDVTTEEFRKTATDKFDGLSAQGEACKEKLDFLMQATEMIKRKSKEASKANEKKFGEVSEEQDKHTNQMAALERQLKRQERDLRAAENRASRAENAVGGSLKALPAPTASGPLELLGGGELTAEALGNNKLNSILDQLAKIGAGGHPFEQMGVDVDANRPPLPWAGEERRGMDHDATSLPRFTGQAGPAPIDSARGPAYPAATGSARYASPRQVGGAAGIATAGGMAAAGGRTPRRKK